MSDTPLTKVANFPSIIEAELAVSLLESAGIEAIALGNDTAGIFGAGFSGPSSRGADVLVRADRVDEAREVLSSEVDAP